MNKKSYISPAIISIKLEATELLAASNGFAISNDEITGDVASNGRLDAWDEDED